MSHWRSFLARLDDDGRVRCRSSRTTTWLTNRPALTAPRISLSTAGPLRQRKARGSVGHPDGSCQRLSGVTTVPDIAAPARRLIGVNRVPLSKAR